MAHYNNLLHYYETDNSFKEHLDNELISPDSICFLAESSQIYTQNTFFGIPKKDFETLKELVEDNCQSISDIIGDSTEEHTLKNLADITAFLNGYTKDVTLTEVIKAIETSLNNQISGFIVSVEESIANSSKDVDERLNNVEGQVSSISEIVEESADNAEAARNLAGVALNNIGAVEEQITVISSNTNTLIESVNTNIKQVQNSVARINNLIGAADGIAPLGPDSKIPSANLPSYVDDVLEYSTKSEFPVEGESGKIYVTLDTNLTYRWSGTTYTEISPSIALGETSSTAYPGNKGKEATNNINAHIENFSNPHRVSKDQIGLSDVDNTSDVKKPISEATQKALDDKVNIVEGKELSTNDFTDELKDKLECIEEGANNYTLPIASDTEVGGVKIGDGLSIRNGVLSVSNQVIWLNID